MSASRALRAAIRGVLVADAPLVALLGGPRVYDETPRAQLPPYVALGDCSTADVSGDQTPAEEHTLSIEVWSREGGLSEALRVSDRVVRALDGASPALDGHRLASLAWVFTDAGRAADAGLRRATLRFRAVTEPN